MSSKTPKGTLQVSPRYSRYIHQTPSGAIPTATAKSPKQNNRKGHFGVSPRIFDRQAAQYLLQVHAILIDAIHKAMDLRMLGGALKIEKLLSVWFSGPQIV